MILHQVRREAARKERDDHKAALERTYGTAGNPKANALYDLAWDYGHASGFGEVESYYGEMARLITNYTKEG